VAEGLQGNLFLRKGNLIKTPPLQSGCRAGILRGYLVKHGFGEGSFDLVEEAINPFELQQADELFLLDITHGVQPISGYRKATYSHEAALAVNDLLNAMNPG
jgi:branched-chain amino acid aminotransferase